MDVHILLQPLCSPVACWWNRTARHIGSTALQLWSFVTLHGALADHPLLSNLTVQQNGSLMQLLVTRRRTMKAPSSSVRYTLHAFQEARWHWPLWFTVGASLLHLLWIHFPSVVGCIVSPPSYPPHFICWNPSLHYLRMWLYLEIGMLRAWSVKTGAYWSRKGPGSVWPGSL